MGLTNFKSAATPFSHGSRTIGWRIYIGNNYFGQYGLFGAMPGPSCCISVPFMSRNVLTIDEVSIEGVSSISSPFGPVSCLFRPIWSILAHGTHSGPFPFHRAEFLLHLYSELCSWKIKPIKKDSPQFPVHLGPYLVCLGPYGPFWPIWSSWDHVSSIRLHFCSISVHICAQKR